MQVKAKGRGHRPLTEPPPEGPAQRLLDNLSTAVLALDAGMRLSAINPAGEMLLAASAKKVLGQGLAGLLAPGERLLGLLADSFAANHAITARSLALTFADGRAVTVDCTVTPIADGERGAVLLVELAQIDRLLRLAREDMLRDRQAANRAVLRGLAHEIKNPLGGLRGAAQLLERELPDRALTEYTRIIIHEADRLRNLVDRMIGPHQPSARRALNIHEVLEHVRRLTLAENPVGLDIHTDYDPSLPEIRGDTEQLIQAVLNVVRNAVQAMNGRGTIRLRTRVERGVSVGARRHRLVLRTDIEDSGPGIPEGLREQIFYPMVTGRADGTGLGLAIAQDIAQRHGGLIECQSRPGHTVFTLLLPVEEDT